MTLIDRLKKTLRAGGQTEQRFNYHCRECTTEFETTEQSRAAVDCPNCGAAGARSITTF